MGKLTRSVFTAFLLAAGFTACDEVVHDVGTLGKARSTENGASGSGAAADSAENGTDGGADAAPSDTNAAADATRPDDSGHQEDPICQGRSVAAEPRRLDIYIMMDGSLMIELPVIMRTAKLGVDAFLQDPDSNGTAVGIRYFGVGCEPYEYAVPDVPVAELPGNTAALESFTPSAILTPLPVVPALRGAILHARERQGRSDLDNTKQAVFLLTSEIYTGCGNIPDDLDTAAQEGFQGSPSIETYAFGVAVFSLLNPTDLTSFRDQLGQVALLGGTNRPFLADLGISDEELAARLAEARDAAMPSRCDFAYPDWVDSAPGDPELVTLTYSGPSGDAVQVPRVSSAAECDPFLEGWYYDEPARPSRVIACGLTCETIESDPAPDIGFILGCAPPAR